MSKMLAILALSLFLSSPSVVAAAPAEADVLYMNHGPLRPTLDKLKALFSGFGDKLVVRWHDFESPEGEKFMDSKGISQHTPLMIWINGRNSVEVDGAPVAFSGFPSGAGPAMFQGKWTLEALAKALELAARPN